MLLGNVPVLTCFVCKAGAVQLLSLKSFDDLAGLSDLVYICLKHKLKPTGQRSESHMMTVTIIDRTMGEDVC